MKKLIAILTVCIVGISARAQSITNLLPAQSFLTTAMGWATSFDTNNQMFQTNDRVEISTGTENFNNQNMEAVFKARLNPWKGLELGAEMHNVSALGTISSEAGVLGWGVVHYDFRLTGELVLGYRNDAKCGFVEPRILAEKAMTQNSAVGVWLGLPMQFQHQQATQPSFGLLATVSFL